MKAKKNICELTCMDELFTTKIAKCTNKINIVNFNFTRTLIYFLNALVFTERVKWHFVTLASVCISCTETRCIS